MGNKVNNKKFSMFFSINFNQSKKKIKKTIIFVIAIKGILRN